MKNTKNFLIGFSIIPILISIVVSFVCWFGQNQTNAIIAALIVIVTIFSIGLGYVIMEEHK